MREKKQQNQESGIGTQIVLCIVSLALAVFIFATQTGFVFLRVIPLPFWLMGGFFALIGLTSGRIVLETLLNKKK